MKPSTVYRPLSLCLLFALVASTSAATDDLGMRVGHLNLVTVASDEDANRSFYAETLGLEALETWTMSSSGAKMLRYRAGVSELKFIVYPDDVRAQQKRYAGPTGDARGIRLIAVILPASTRAGIEERIALAGLDAVQFTERTEPVSFAYGMTFDPDGNQIELVFLDDDLPPSAFEQMQVGLTVSDVDAMSEFLDSVLGLELVSDDASAGVRIARFAVGPSQIKFWHGDSSLPAHVGPPHTMIGMSLLQFIVNDVDAVRDLVLKRGGSIHTEPYRLGKSTTIMFVDGPDGILFEFAGPLLPRLAGEPSGG